MALLAEGYSECQVASIFKILKTVVHKSKDIGENKVTDWQRVRNDSPLTGIMVNPSKVSFKKKFLCFSSLHSKNYSEQAPPSRATQR